MTEIARHLEPASPKLKDMLEGREARGPGPEVPHFRALVGQDPYPWQRRLYARLVAGGVPQAVDVPTGCGKTACVLLVLLARLENPSLPRRVVHVVDRRALVDQSAEAVRGWVDRMGALPSLSRAFDGCAAFPAPRPVALGVLRGGYADEGAWRLDPARPAVLVGTVDMVGSRLLFAGYGSGRSRRARDAGLLGHDALVLLDEAHLAPAMAGLLDSVARLEPTLRVMRLSATAPGGCGEVLGLGPDDLEDDGLRRRLAAVKRARLVEVATPAKRIGALVAAAAGHRTGAVAVFVERVADARRVASRLARAMGPERVAVLTGTLRGHERAALASGAVWRRFSPGRDRTEGGRPSVHLVMTSAGEVGVDLDADHAVMDLSPLDSMAQRLGRVNRAGLGRSTVTVVHAAGNVRTGARTETPAARLAAAKRETIGLLRGLPNLSPAALRAVDPETFARCAAPGAEPPRLDRAVVEAFAMTSADLPLPRVGIYLKGVSPAREAPQTWLAWRRDVADLVVAGPEAAGAALSFFPLLACELARAPAPYATRLIARALAREGKRGLPLVVLGRSGEPYAARATRVEDLPPLDFATVVLPPGAGGLSPEGLPDEDAPGPVPDVGDTARRVRTLVRKPSDGGDAAGGDVPAWVADAASLRVPVPDEDGEPERAWVYALRRPGPDLATSELTWLGGSTETLDEHGRRVGEAARRLGVALGLETSLVETLGRAGAAHDTAKSRRVWQLAAGAPVDGAPLAKSRRGRLRTGALGGYRHELGSVADAERALRKDIPHRGLVLHLVAAHHGWARPGFPPAGQWDPECSAAESRARAARIADRYARLSAELGPWRLAWLEALLKSADAWVSSGRGA